MAMLVTLDQVKQQLHIVLEDTSRDADLTRLMDAGEAIVLDYIAKSQAGRDAIATWLDPDTVPKHVQHAILYQIGELDSDRTGESATRAERDEDQDLSRVVIGLLRRITDPVLA